MTKTASFKGHPTLSLNAEERFPFTFGVAKAKLILQNIDAIRAFVQANEAQAASRFDQDTEDRNAERLALGGAQ